MPHQVMSKDHIRTVHERIAALRKYSQAEQIRMTAAETGQPVETVREVLAEEEEAA